MRIEITQRLQKVYPNSTFVAVLAEDFENNTNSNFLEREREKTEDLLKKNKDISKNKNLINQRKFFEKRKKTYPIEYQAKSIAKGKNIPSQCDLIDALFISEMKHFACISGHDLSHLGDKLVFDITGNGEKYVDISGKSQKLEANDIVLRDGENVITSLLYGPGKSTKLTKKTKSCLYLFWYSDEIPRDELDLIVDDFKSILKKISSKKSKVNDIRIISSEGSDSRVTPWQVLGKVDYDRLIDEFGVQKITDSQRKYIEKIAKKKGMDLHVFLRRGLFYAHMDLDKFIEAHKKRKPIFLYTGRAPGGSMHIGHLIPFLFTKYLQDVFDCNLYIQIPDDEKFMFKKDLTLENVEEMMRSDLEDISAIGFDPDKTFIFRNTEFVQKMYVLTLKIAKRLTFSQARNTFGFEHDSNVAQIFYPALQMTPSHFEKGQCLIPCAIDQNPYFLLQRDIGPKIGYLKNATILSKFLSPLTGFDGKMSASDSDKAVLMTDDADTVKKKINKYAFSGGRDTLEQHRMLGGNTKIDVSYQWLYNLFEEDDKEIERIRVAYESGEMLTGELKGILIEKINSVLKKHNNEKEKAKKRNLLERYMYSGKLAKHMWKSEFK